MVKKRTLSKKQIISEAIKLADQGGLDALSMRKLAAKLDIHAMSLYHHFKTKNELITHMAETLIVKIAVKEDNGKVFDWRNFIQKRAIRAKTLFQQHMWLPYVIDSHMQSGPKRLEYINNYIEKLCHAGFSVPLAVKVMSLVDSYIYGFCRELSHITDSGEAFDEQAENFSEEFEADEYPFLNEATKLVMENGYDENADFLFGLKIILNGIDLELKLLNKS